MYSNNIVNFQESTTILNACTKKSGNLLNAPRNSSKTKLSDKFYGQEKKDADITKDIMKRTLTVIIQFF